MNNSTELPALTPGPDDALTNKFCKHALNRPPACCLWHLTVSLRREAFTGMIRSQKASDRARSPRHLVVPVYSGELRDMGQCDDDVDSNSLVQRRRPRQSCRSKARRYTALRERTRSDAFGQ